MVTVADDYDRLRIPPDAVTRDVRYTRYLERIVLRHLERTLTDQQANQLRDRIYAAPHQGSARQWATPLRQLDVANGLVDLR